MVVTQPGTDVPFSQIDLVLNKCGLFEIPFPAVELERSGSAVVELREIGDDVAELFVDIGGIGLEAGLPFTSSLVNGQRFL